MKIGINAQALTQCSPCGINTYIRNLIPSLCSLDQKNHFILFASKQIELKGVYQNLEKKRGRAYASFSLFGFSKLFNESNCDIAFIPKEIVPLFVNKPTVITVFDLFFLKMYRKFRNQIPFSTKMHYEVARLFSFKKAAKLCAISESCKQDLIEICNIKPEKIEVTPLSYDPHIFYPRTKNEIEGVLKRFGIERPYLVNISSQFWAPKNVMGVLRAFHLLQEGGFPHELIMIGKIGPSYSEMQNYIHRHQLRVKCLLSVHVEDLASLLSGAIALVYPSFHEGFGLPILEAMASNCPVITSNVTAMPETAGEAALLIDPYQPEAIFHAMKSLIEDSDLSNKLKTRGLKRATNFSWSITGERTLHALLSV